MTTMFRFPVVALILCLTTLAFAQQGPSPVMVAPVEQEAVPLTDPLVATVVPVLRTTIAAEQEGLVHERHFDEGSLVDAKALLLELNVDLLNAQKTAAEAAQDSAKAELNRAKLEAANAERELQRVRTLFEQQVAPEKEYLDAQTSFDSATALIRVREAQLAERVAEIARLQLQIDKTRVHAPFEGVISRRYVERGAWVRAGDPVADLVQLKPLWVEVNAPESVIGRVRQGDVAYVALPTIGIDKIEGKVDQIMPEGDTASRTFRLRVRIENPDGTRRPGFFARATLVNTASEPQLLVPKDAVVRGAQGTYVVIARDGKAEIAPVRVIRQAGERTAIAPVAGPLVPGDLVITRGNESLPPGADLMILNAPQPAPVVSQ